MCHAGLRRPGRCVFRAVALRLHGTASGGCEVARCLCVRNDGGEGTGRNQGRKDIVVIMKFARKQRKHIYPLPVVYHPPPSLFLFYVLPTYLPTPLPLFGLRKIKKSKRRSPGNYLW